jgi:mono/diheme cytochrome c family protein
MLPPDAAGVRRGWAVFWRGAAVAGVLGCEALVAGPVSFNREVLPILAEHCFACHGPDEAGRKGGLQLHVREAALGRRKSGGQVIVPGDAEGSLLMQRVLAEDADEVMPPPESGARLTEREVEILRRWIGDGAVYEAHWAFLQPQRVSPPELGGVVHPVDRFVRERLLEEGIDPAPEAERGALIRRLTLDLTGLLPSADEVEAFLKDQDERAYERLVDRLLGSVHFGEKWARWWLDLAHYGDSDGIRLDSARPYAWRYRQWVVDALNEDLPFDQFTIRQLAGDQLPGAGESEWMGTGFLRNTISDRQTGNADPALARVRMVVDRTATVGAVWLGLGLECAECHDHKFDPISQKDFYGLYAFFNRAEEVNRDAPLPGEWAAHEAGRRRYEVEQAALLAPVADELERLQAVWEEKMLFTELNPGLEPAWMRAYELFVTGWGRGMGEGQFEGMMIVKTPVGQRTAVQRERLQDYFIKSGAVVDPERFKELGLAELSKQLEVAARKVPPLARAPAMTDLPQSLETYVHTRGDFRRPGEVVKAGVPEVLPVLQKSGGDEPGRLDLARWLVSPEHPLTARVTVNRLWQELFGAGLVATSDNLGMRGERPSHPELLDWLATEFVARDWSIKQMLRLMVSSATYRQSSAARPELADRDPENKLLARQVKLRLSAEGVRDAALGAGGLLDLSVGGPSVQPPQPESVIKENTRNKWVVEKGAGRYRRGLYTYIQRLAPFAQFANFDLPGTAKACSMRGRSNTPLQALNLLNDPSFVEAAVGLAGRMCEQPERGVEESLERGFLLALARRPEAGERERLWALLEQQRTHYQVETEAARELVTEAFGGHSHAESAAWVMVASVLLNLHEFFHRE